MWGMRRAALPATTPLAGRLILVRHGRTEWSENGRHTGVTDLPLLPEGEEDGRRLGRRLEEYDIAVALTSPRQRARRTAELALAQARRSVLVNQTTLYKALGGSDRSQP